MFTMLPPLFARRCGTAALQPYHALFVLRRNDSSHSASGMSSNLQRVIGTTLSMPALFTMPVSFPNACAARSTALLNFAKSRTSVARAIAWPPFSQVPSDEDRDAAIVTCELRHGALRVTRADRVEERFVVLRRVLQRRPAQRARDLLAQPRDEVLQARSPCHRIALDVEAFACRELRVA